MKAEMIKNERMFRYINGASSRALHDVEVHDSECKDARAKLRSMDYADAGTVPAMGAGELWVEYNADFMEDPFALTIFPCTKLIHTKMTYEGI